MRKFISSYLFLLIFIVLSAITVVSCEKEEQERDIEASEVPQTVLQAFNQAYAGAVVKGYAEEMENGQKYYEVSCIFEGRKIDALYRPDGTVEAIEEVIPAEQLPAAVKRGIAAESADFSVNLAEKIEKEGKVLYEVKVINTRDQKRYELLFSDMGKLVEKSEMKKRESEENEEEQGEEAEEMNEATTPSITVPEAVMAAFEARFPAAEEVQWGKESESEFEAEFEMHEKVMSANFDTSGLWLITETALSEKELPAGVLDALKKEFSGYDIEKAEKLEEGDKPVLFEVNLEKGDKEMEAVLNEAGQVLKKEINSEKDN